MNMEISALSYSDRYASTYTKDNLLLINYQPLKEGDEVCTKAVHHPGYMLAFDFVWGDGTREDFHHHDHGAFLPPND